MRYFLKLSYRGSKYHGWQIQPESPSIQQKIVDGLSIILRTPIEITGCGRTDTGVHARDYVAHFDYGGSFPSDFLKRINKCLPEDIAIVTLSPVSSDAHARFDAKHRAYEYHVVFSKTPFDIDTAYHFPFLKDLDLEKLQAAAALLLEYKDFFPFCKTNTQVKTMRCELFRSEWEVDEENGKMIFHIAANRFLRGMVRLIVGMCLNVATGKITLASVKNAMETQTRLPKSLSVPPHGLYLVDIRYPYAF
ncbi:MAG: tRNA pseudouridine38-40 synthase [Saprospiraceae bacterium]|jgi:tRNA pseudouridine38-40 synthase